MTQDVFASHAVWRNPVVWAAGVPALFAAALSVDPGGGPRTAATDPLPDSVVAAAAGHQLTVGAAAALLAPNPQIPADSLVIQSLAEFWIDYTLLAEAVARDSTLAVPDMDAATLAMRNDMVRMRLVEREVRVDTVFTDQELSRLWADQGPGTEVRVRHILLQVPEGATPAERDSVRRQAEALRLRAANGEDFARLASEHSQEPGSSEDGGDLGYFPRGRMVQPFEDAAFRLQPGQISPVTETPFGYHVIKVEDRRTLPLDEADIAEFRTSMVQQARIKADSLYVDSVARGTGLRIAPGAAAAVREAGRRPASVREPAAAGQELATYNGGRYTVADLAEPLRTLTPQTRRSLIAATDAELEQAVRGLAIQRILLERARTVGLGLTREEEDSVRGEARLALRQLLESSGFDRFAGTGTQAPARQAAVTDLLRRAVLGEVPITPLGVLGSVLRDRYGTEVNDRSLPLVIEEIGRLRAAAPAPD
jgi:peptidyl-prolyl cis-trans isomerase C